MNGGPDADPQDQSCAGEADGPEFLDRSKLDFDPDDGLYTGTAVHGLTAIPHEQEQRGDADQ
jgi:hypothetical protein